VLLVGPQAEALAPRLEASGYRGVREDAGAVAEAGAPRTPPDAVILSPGCGGRIGEFRWRWPGIPLLLGVEGDTVEDRRLCLANGADDCWLPSLAPSDLLSRLRLHLRLRPESAARGSWLRLADLEVETASRRIRRARRPIQLSEREYQLLLLLLRHSGEVVSRDRILREIWPESSSSSNVIEVYIRYLRRKLEAGGESRLIHTVRGQGYTLFAPSQVCRMDNQP
jgi:DNA-binding response OmpR family regulator